MKARAAVSLAVVAALAAAPGRAGAAACCVSATSFGVGRLLAWEDAAAGVQVSHARSLGVWNAQGSLRGAGFSDGLTTTMPWAILRVVDRVQLQAWVPYVVNDRASNGQTQVAGGLGDVGAAARVEVLKIGEYVGLPSFAFTLGALAPTGTRVEETSLPLFAGTTGRGAWAGTLAVESELAFLPWFVRADAGVTAFLPFTRSDTGDEQQYGPILQAALSGGRELVPDVLVAALAVTGEWQSALEIAGKTIPESKARSLALAASLAWRFDPRWTVNLSVNNTVWPDGAAENRDARLGFTVGVRRGHF